MRAFKCSTTTTSNETPTDLFYHTSHFWINQSRYVPDHIQQKGPDYTLNQRHQYMKD